MSGVSVRMPLNSRNEGYNYVGRCGEHCWPGPARTPMTWPALSVRPYPGRQVLLWVKEALRWKSTWPSAVNEAPSWRLPSSRLQERRDGRHHHVRGVRLEKR